LTEKLSPRMMKCGTEGDQYFRLAILDRTGSFSPARQTRVFYDCGVGVFRAREVQSLRPEVVSILVVPIGRILQNRITNR
jgi:hypothetical protein